MATVSMGLRWVVGTFQRKVSALQAALVAWRTWAPVVATAVIAFVTRFAVEAQHPGPSGSDYGNYLTNVSILWGRDVTGGGLQYPPLYLLFLTALLRIFDPLTALQISGPLVVALLAFPAYKLMRLYSGHALSIGGVAILVFADTLSELIGWGGNPQVFAGVFMIWLSYAGILALETGRRREAIMAGLALSLVAGSHQLALLEVLLLAGLVLGGLGILLRSSAMPKLKVGLEIGVWAVLFSLPYVPFYLQITDRLAPFAPPNPIIPQPDSLTVNIDFVLRYAGIWFPLMGLALIGYMFLIRESPIRAVVGLVLLLGPLALSATIFAYHPARPLYFLPLGIVPGFLVAIRRFEKFPQRFRSPRITRGRVHIVSVFAVAAVVAAVAIASEIRMEAASSTYYVLGDDVVESISWLRDRTLSDSRIVTNGPTKNGIDELAGCKWGWWIEGYAQRKALCTATLPFLAYRDQVPDSNLANLVFSGRHIAVNEYWRVGENGPQSPIGTPLLSGNFAGGYKGAALFDDSAVLIDLSNGLERPWEWGGRTYAQTLTPNLAEIMVSYARLGASLARTTDLAAGSRNVTLSIRLQGPATKITIPLFATSNSRLSPFDPAIQGFDLLAHGDFEEENRIPVRVFAENATLAGGAPIVYGSPITRYDMVFNLGGQGSKIRFIFSNEGTVGPAPTVLSVVDSTALLRQGRINLVFVSRERPRDVARFLSDDCLQLVHRNGSIDIYAFKTGAVGCS